MLIMKQYFQALLSVILFLFGISQAFSQFESEIECFSIIAGKNSTIDHSVMIAHNEDDWGDLLVNWYKVPEQDYPTGAKIQLQNGAQIEQARHTYSYLWVEMPGMQFSDSYMNQWGLTIASDQCKSREDKAEIVDGGIGFYLRRIMIERAKTAKEAVKIAGKLIEKLGYNYSGRTYCIADPSEAWMMAVVKGKHWVAQRIPSDQVAVIPNHYTIGEIDLSDTLNFLGSKDIYDYAVERNWYNPNSNKPFSFKKAYADQSTLKAIWNTPRFMTAINMLAKDKVNYGDDFPFSFIPKKKIAKQDIMKVLASHLEDTDFESCSGKNPHDNIVSRICSPGNQYGFVAQLRSNLPAEIAHVMWLSLKRPCTQAFVPWYFGIERIPKEFTYEDYNSALSNHFSRVELKEKTKTKAYWQYKKLADITDKDYSNLSVLQIKNKNSIEKKLFDDQENFENKFVRLYAKNKTNAIEFLQQYEEKVLNTSLNNTKEILKNIKKAVPNK